MASSRGSVNLDALRAATYKRQNSPIFAPFMINVVCNLLNSQLIHYENQVNTQSYIGKWGGGLNQLKQCYPEWDKQVSAACKITPIGHPIWSKFVHANSIANRESFDAIQILQHLLQHWCNTGRQHNTYGPYPSPFEQGEYVNTAIVPMGHISQAIADLTFEACFKANKMDIETFIKQQNQQQNQQQQTMDEDSKDEYKSNNNDSNNTNRDPFDYNNNPFNYNPHPNQSQNFGNHNATNANNFMGYKEEKKEFMIDKSKGGVLYYQSAYYTHEQCANIMHFFMYNKVNTPKVLFGDNNIDKDRPLHNDRLYWGGQAQELGKHDRWFAYGITTTWKHTMNEKSSYFQGNGFEDYYGNHKVDFVTFKHLMDQQFKTLIDHIANGRDVIVPAPTQQDLLNNRSKYFDRLNNRKPFRHNLGTGTADLDEKYLKFIQIKLDQLEQYASNTQDINFQKMYGNKPTHLNPKPKPIAQMQQPITLTPRAQQRQTQYRRDANGLNLPFNDSDILGSQNIPRNNKVQARLNFDEKKQDFDSSVPRPNNMEYTDPYGSIHYESPHRPLSGNTQNNIRNRRGNEHMFPQNSGNTHTQNTNTNEFKQTENKTQSQSQSQSARRQQSLNTPPTNKFGKRPHYKSPTGYVENKEQWDQLSSPQKSNQLNMFSGNMNVPRTGHNMDDDLLRSTANFFLFILFYVPRKIYIALMVQNRPQDVFKIIALMFAFGALVVFGMHQDITNMVIILIVCAILFALCGGDQLYQNETIDLNRNNNNMNGNLNYNFR